MEESIPLLRRLFFKRRGRGKRTLDEETVREYEAHNKAILQEIEVAVSRTICMVN